MKQIDEEGLIKDFNGDFSIAGTHLVGEFVVTYKELKRLFGEPTDGDSYKMDALWVIMTPAGAASIYNYKDGRNYLGKEGKPKTKITNWHIGGSNLNTYAWVAFAIYRN